VSLKVARVADTAARSADTTAWVAETVYLLEDVAFGSKNKPHTNKPKKGCIV